METTHSTAYLAHHVYAAAVEQSDPLLMEAGLRLSELEDKLQLAESDLHQLRAFAQSAVERIAK